MLKLIMNQVKATSIQKSINMDSNGFHSFNVEFSQDDERYHINEQKMIFAIVTNGKLDIKLSINGRPLIKLNEEETQTIKRQLLA